jgi:hypothetical protein
MANTWGGMIIIGVDEDDSAPKLPVSGFPFKEHLREQINNLILGNITPPVFPEIQIAASTDGQLAFAVIRIAQSPLTPHAIRGNTQVYVRTDTSNEPEELATLDRVQWLVERRKKSEELKESFFQRSAERFNALCLRKNLEITRGDTAISMVPLYPFETLQNPRTLRETTLNQIYTRGWGMDFPRLMRRVGFEAVQAGTYGFFPQEEQGDICYEELNQYGFFYHRESLAEEEEIRGEKAYYAYLFSLMTHLDMFLESMTILYSSLGYWGMVELRVTMLKFNGVRFRDLPPRRGYMKIDSHTSSPLEKDLKFERNLLAGQLAENRSDLVPEIISEIAWAVGFSHIKPSDVLALMKEAGRA